MLRQTARSLAALLPALVVIAAAGAEPRLARIGELPGGALAREAFVPTAPQS